MDRNLWLLLKTVYFILNNKDKFRSNHPLDQLVIDDTFSSLKRWADTVHRAQEEEVEEEREDV